MELRFVKADPCGNTTAIVLDPVHMGLRPRVARAVMLHTSLAAEQVAFSVPALSGTAAGRVEMMGGEFCGNAVRALGAWLAMGERLRPLCGSLSIPVEISGQEGLLMVEIEGDGGYGGRAAVDMPLPRAVRHGADSALGDYSLVAFEGISHAVLWDAGAEEGMIEPAKNLLDAGGLGADAYGVLFLAGTTDKMTPVVSVDGVASRVWENSCGSGSVAVACALADRREESVRLHLAQPGGTLSVQTRWEDGCSGARLKGDVRITAAGIVAVHLEGTGLDDETVA